LRIGRRSAARHWQNRSSGSSGMICARMGIDREKIDNIVLVLPWLTLHDERHAWKDFDWDTLDRLHTKGFNANPASKVPW
jgi:hypothetical protein